MTGLVDPRVHAGAVKAALNATLNNQAYDYDEVPGLNNNDGVIPDIFAMVSIERRAVTVTRSSYTTKRTGWRVAVRCQGRTVDECRWALFQTAQALDETRLSIGGIETTPIALESDQAPSFVEGRYSAHALYTYAH